MQTLDLSDIKTEFHLTAIMAHCAQVLSILLRPHLKNDVVVRWKQDKRMKTCGKFVVVKNWMPLKRP